MIIVKELTKQFKLSRQQKRELGNALPDSTIQAVANIGLQRHGTAEAFSQMLSARHEGNQCRNDCAWPSGAGVCLVEGLGGDQSLRLLEVV